MFSYSSARARKARLSHRIPVWLARVCLFLMFLTIVSGATLALFGQNYGLLILALAPILFAIYYIKTFALTMIPPVENGHIDGVLSDSVLALIPENPTPKDIARAVGQAQSERFLALRFGISLNFLEQVADVVGADSEIVWRKSIEIARYLNAPIVSGGIIATALVALAPNYETVLASVRLSFEDLLDGIKWHDRLMQKFRDFKKPILTGGIARDWSFGFTPLLNRFARNISAEISYHGGRTMSTELPSHAVIVEQIIQILGSGSRRNVAIVGQSGAGKTSLVHDLAERLIDGNSKNLPDDLRFNQIFLLDSSALIAAAPNAGQLEQLLTAIFNEAYSAKNIILCLDDAQLFFQEGTGSVDISNLILPVLTSGGLRLILTLNEQKLLEISAHNPALINAINRINIEGASQEETMAALEDRAIQLEHDNKVVFNYQALKEVYHLSQKYIHDLIMPGRALKLLEMSVHYGEKFGRTSFITPKSIAYTIEQTLGARVGGQLNDNAEKSTLLNLESLIHQRMINQDQAVRVVSDALRRARTGVRNDKKPIGTFLFLGPTGVGKTELAKALATIYFRDENNLIRVDLNQFSSPESVNDLTADGASNPDSLTAQAMKRPFSVVLLDEIEKAHNNVLASLLQLLDEGILRDSLGREISFRDCIIIATSNAGANQIRELVANGVDLSHEVQNFTNGLIASGQFAPEFINRFDEIVLFKPLGQSELLQIVDLLLTGINKTLAPQKIRVEVDTEARELLAKIGYDPSMGARPLRRIVQRTVENEVSKRILAGSASGGSVIRLTAHDIQNNLQNQ